VKLHARWTGAPPNVGDYLMSTTRPRFAYLICEISRVDRIVSWDPVLKTEFQYFKIATERKPLDAVPKDARVHSWHWDKREPRRKQAV
jgi:hypothetical protein